MSLTSLKKNYIIYLMDILFGSGDGATTFVRPIFLLNVIDSGEHTQARLTQAHSRNPGTHPQTVAQAPEPRCHPMAKTSFCITTELERFH